MREDVDAVDAATPSETVRVLPGHDPSLIGPGTKDAFLPNRFKPTSRNANLVVVGGVVCGTWARTGDELIVGWLNERRRPDRAVEQRVTRLSSILGPQPANFTRCVDTESSSRDPVAATELPHLGLWND